MALLSWSWLGKPLKEGVLGPLHTETSNGNKVVVEMDIGRG